MGYPSINVVDRYEAYSAWFKGRSRRLVVLVGKVCAIAEILHRFDDAYDLCPAANAVLVYFDFSFYEEPLSQESVERAIVAIENADALIVVGTSLSVYPAASYIRFFKGKDLVLINKGETRYDSLASLSFTDDVIKVIDALE